MPARKSLVLRGPCSIFAASWLFAACGEGGGSPSIGSTDGEQTSASEAETEDSSRQDSTSASAADDSTGSTETSDAGPSNTSEGSDETGGPACAAVATKTRAIWIPETTTPATVARVDTDTLQVQARYLTGPDSSARSTSVNLNGDIVVSSFDGLTAIAGAPERCRAGSPTSTGPEDVAAWPDACVLWRTPLDSEGKHPVAWSAGEWDPVQCRWAQTSVWTVGRDSTEGSGDAWVHRLDGDTGEIVGTVQLLAEFSVGFRFEDTAVDAAGDFWTMETPSPGAGNGVLLHFAAEESSVNLIDLPVAAYAMTIDHAGRIWTCSANLARFDPLTETWDIFDGPPGNGSFDCAEDRNGVLWTASTSGVIGYDTDDGTQQVALQALDQPGAGMSIDESGKLWLLRPPVDVFVVDPQRDSLVSLTELHNTITLSDMTGLELRNVVGQ